jgi:iron complex outermembrane recepter protein
MRLTKSLLLGACPLAVFAAPALAQSTGSEAIETVVVTGTRVNMSGLSSFDLAAKQTSSINQDFIKTQTAGQTFFENLNYLPGFNFENTDSFGSSSSGGFRMHGQDDAHISVTLDGMPLNDTGNYAMYTSQMIDPEITARVNINQGTTDVDSPTAAVTGGTIATRARRPADEFSVTTNISGGSNNFKRDFVSIDTGKIGPFDTSGYVTYSYSDYDKFKGSGKMFKTQMNADIHQDFGSLGWVDLAASFNRGRNTYYYYPNYTGGGINKSDWKTDYDASCVYNTNSSGTVTAPSSSSADKTMTTCSNWYKLKNNPSDTGNIRLSSLWHLLPELTVTVDTSLQYVLANGGSTTTMYEHSPQLVGASGTYSSTTSTATTAAYGCITGGTGGCDLNGDGDVRDQVMIYRPNTTNTRRWGFNTSFIYAPAEGHTLRVAYTLDYGLHVQTGVMGLIDPVNGPYSMWAGYDDDAHKIITADCPTANTNRAACTGKYEARRRDRRSKAILNQVSFDYQGDFLNDMVHASIGARLPFLERDLNMNCYTKIGDSYNPLCTTEAPNAADTYGRLTFTGVSGYFLAPESAVVRYNRFLPHIGFTFKPFGDEHLIFVNYTQEMAAPKTDNLYNATGTTATGYSVFARVAPETSTTYTIGYRFLSEGFNASLVLWNTQVKHRIVSSFDPDENMYYDHNIKGVNNAGVDVDATYQITKDLSVYGSGSFSSARILGDMPSSYTSGSTTISYNIPTAGKQMTNIPNWTFAGYLQYNVVPTLHFSLGAKFVGRKFATETNNIKVPSYYKVNTSVAYDLDDLGMVGSSLRLNVDNLFDKKYYGYIGSTQTCYAASATASCRSTTKPGVYAAAPRTLMLTLSAKY